MENQNDNEKNLDRGLVLGSKEHIDRWKKEQGIEPECTEKSMPELLRDKKKGDEKKLTFDKDTGELIVLQNPNADNIVVDQVYKEGFFLTNYQKQK